ncbi:MAG: hypothetical protein ACYSTL_00010 [Planctomycetota bacterium]|jgi:hypothetical protein
MSAVDRCTEDGRIRRNAGRRGSVYVFVLATALLVTVIGLAAITLARINIRRSGMGADQTEAMSLAGSAIEAAVTHINTIPEWRFYYQHGVETPQIAFGNGTVSWKLIDPDGNLSDDPTDPVRLLGIGRAGDSAWVYTVMLDSTSPLPAIKTCIHSQGELFIKAGKSITADGAPASTNNNFRNDGILYGDIEAVTQSGGGGVTGSVTIPAPIKQLPDPGVFLLYAGKATILPFSGHLDRHVITPTINEYGGGVNPNGIYYLNTNGNDLTIKKSRIHGTLVIDAGTRLVKIDNEVLLQNFRPDCPVLIVRGRLELTYRSDVLLSESVCGHNFNPPGAPYGGEIDADMDDQYPSEIRGLVHVTGSVFLKNTQTIRGMILSGGGATIEADPKIIYDPRIAKNPPEGYTTAEGELSIVPGSWERAPLY